LENPSDERGECPEQQKSPRFKHTPPLLIDRRFFVGPDSWCETERRHTMKQLSTASIRILADNPNHHLWNNNGTFWCHYTLHLPDYTKRRVRQSLGTCCIEQARKLRDQLLRRALKGGAL
jgi:hypothetical protein